VFGDVTAPKEAERSCRGNKPSLSHPDQICLESPKRIPPRSVLPKILGVCQKKTQTRKRGPRGVQIKQKETEQKRLFFVLRRTLFVSFDVPEVFSFVKPETLFFVRR
jgi:hypothetical protein